MPMLEDSGTRIYFEEEWEHGLMCAECPHVFREGEPYSERLYAFTEDVPIVQVVCLGCALA